MLTKHSFYSLELYLLQGFQYSLPKIVFGDRSLKQLISIENTRSAAAEEGCTSKAIFASAQPLRKFTHVSPPPCFLHLHRNTEVAHISELLGVWVRD